MDFHVRPSSQQCYRRQWEFSPLKGEGEILYFTKLAIIFLAPNTLQTMIMLWQHLSYNSAQKVNISLDPEYTGDICDVGLGAKANGIAVRQWSSTPSSDSRPPQRWGHRACGKTGSRVGSTVSKSDYKCDRTTGTSVWQEGRKVKEDSLWPEGFNNIILVKLPRLTGEKLDLDRESW